MLKVAGGASILLIVAYALYVTTDTITMFAAGMAEFVMLAAKTCLGTGVFAVGVVSVWWLRRQSNDHNRQRDGAFPLREYHLEPWTKRAVNTLAGRPSPKLLLDVNSMMTHGAMIYQGIHLAEPAAGWDRQLAYMGDIERTRRMQALAPGDNVLGNPLVSLPRGMNGVANAATGRLAAGAYDRQPRTIDVRPTPVAPSPMLAAPELTAHEAVAQSAPAKIVMGQTATGDIVRWNMAQTPHLRFHGMTQGSGKTNAIQTVAAGALRTGAHVVVCDRVQFKDWQDFEGRAEFVDTSDPRRLADAAARLLNIYQGRTRQLAKAGVKNIEKYPNGMQRIVVVVSEFGAQMDTARAEGMLADVERPFVELARLAGSTGIHLVAEDQAVRGWHRLLIANLIPAIGRMPAHAGQACGYQGRGGGTDTFPSYTFWHEGVMIHTPHMEPDLPAVLAPAPAPSRLVMLTPPARGEMVSEERSTVPDGIEGGGVDAVPTVPPLENVPFGTATGTPQADVPGRWDSVVATWFDANPQALTGPAKGISDLARAMCLDNEGSIGNYNAYKGRAFDLFHDYRNGGAE